MAYSKKAPMKKIYSICLIVFSFVISTNAQDIHFSQYWTAPQLLNPANTGKFNGVFRATFNYRNQWFTIPTLNSVAPYQTYHASIDAPLFREKLGNNGFGIGASFFNDKAGDGALSTNSALISIAYHQSLDRYGNNHLSFGLQAGVVTKQINITDLIFETQLENYGWNRNLSNGETNFNNKTLIYPDVNVGARFTSRIRDNIKFNFGAAVNHIAEPRESFLQDEKNKLGRRYTFHTGADISLGREGYFSIHPTFLFMLQSQARQFNLGLGLNYQLNDNIGIFGGGFYRVQDAGIVQVGVDIYNARIGVSYDINHSGLRYASKAQGALECSVVYIFKAQKDQDVLYPKYCPKF